MARDAGYNVGVSVRANGAEYNSPSRHGRNQTQTGIFTTEYTECTEKGRRIQPEMNGDKQ